MRRLRARLRAAAVEGGSGAPLPHHTLAADEGIDSLVVRLEGDLASATATDGLFAAGGGATNAVCLHRAREAGLGGFEFACAIPGTAGGGVFMNAGAYGRDWSDIVGRALVVSADREEWRSRAQLGGVWFGDLFVDGPLDDGRMEEMLGRGIGQVSRIAGSGFEPDAAADGNNPPRFPRARHAIRGGAGRRDVRRRAARIDGDGQR